MQLFRGLLLATACALAPPVVFAQDAPLPGPLLPGSAQTPAPAPGAPAAPVRIVTPCGNVYEPASLPPAGSPPVVIVAEPCFNRQGGQPTVDGETYVYYMRFPDMVSNPDPNFGPIEWRPYTEAAVQTLREDFERLWQTGFLDDLQIEVADYTFPNGVIGKMVTYNMEERPRVKVITYEGTDELNRTKIEEQLQERGIAIGVDSMLDEQKVRRVETVVREMMVEKGFSPDVRHVITPAAGSSGKTVDITFYVNEGPRMKIRDIRFTGNTAFSDRKLRGQMNENKAVGILSFLTGTGTVNAAMFETDAEQLTAFYMDRGYPAVRVGRPELTIVEDSADGKTRWVELEVPITEGQQYVFGELDFSGNTVGRSEALRQLYDVKPGDTYSRKKIIEGNNQAQKLYGAAGYMEFVPFPELRLSDEVQSFDEQLDAQVPAALRAPEEDIAASSAPPFVDVTIQITEGKQFFVDRIVFTGNTTTKENVIRRELGRLLEGAPFDTTALETSVRRLNQLGYFMPLEPGNERHTKVEKTPGADDRVNVTFNLEEQNRNQLTFGAGVSQYEGFFGQLAFQTSNFLGRGESLTVSLQGGDRAQNYQLGFTEPFLFDRNITGGFDLHKRQLQYIGYYTQKSTGGNLVFGFPVSTYSRMFLSYAYEEVSITDLNEALIDASCLISPDGCSTISSLGDLSQLTDTQRDLVGNNPFFFDSLLIGQGGKRTISKFVPTFLHNTVDHPIFPTQGQKYTASLDLAVLGGNTKFYKPHFEGIWFFPHLRRTSIGLRALFEYIAPVSDAEDLPVFERLFLGGEYSVRGYDIRSIGPTAENSQVVLGGNKSLLFNAEYQISIAQPVRLVLFYDAGQVRDFGESFSWTEDLTRLVPPAPPLLVGPFNELVRPTDVPGVTTEVIGQTSAFKTSTGVELRFFMPVLNVPFRLIYAFNPQRGGVLDNNLQPARRSTFKFSVGTTF